MKTKLLASLFFTCTLLSCNSDKETDPAPVPAKTFNFSFRYDTSLEEAKDYELILSDKGGKVLLDTLLAFNVNHNLSLKSEDTKYNLTTLLIDPIDNSYWIQTYLQVNPDKWRVAYLPSSETPVVKEKADITYTNFPSARDFYFQSRSLNSYRGSITGNTLTINEFTRLVPTDLAYLLVPSHGKYLFTEITSNQTTADFSKAGNTEKRKFNKPANISSFATFLTGYTKAGDRTSSINLYWSPFIPSEEYDLQFPLTVIEEFYLNVSYKDAGGYSHSYSYIGREVPTELDLSPVSNFTITKSGFEDFGVTFTNDKPTIFNSLWGTEDASIEARWGIFSSPDEANYKPKAFLEGLKSKKLAGKDLSVFKLLTGTSRKVNNYSYSEYYDLWANSKLFKENETRQEKSIYKTSF
ncbi:hypothetical protein [Pontibacter chinhatensis]|uniref:Lipoprotein n=1 Tax=Pontibacter chinhatensis TaxID=1436961 RepID=A0A1I2X3W0_9BACT|nr:hypothetical protein [Pontibacter chinhatensis]SFH08215.1 hypothetical protein SAMN05421739_105371 [Pontibacter chinhatensis]